MSLSVKGEGGCLRISGDFFPHNDISNYVHHITENRSSVDLGSGSRGRVNRELSPLWPSQARFVLSFLLFVTKLLPSFREIHRDHLPSGCLC
jgi:hypothetical protein